MRKNITFLLWILFLTSPVRALELNPVTQDTERYLEQKIEKQLSLLFPSIPAVVSVRLRVANHTLENKAKEEREKKKKHKKEEKEKEKDKDKDKKEEAKNDSAKGKDKKDQDRSSLLDMGYLPFPVDSNDSARLGYGTQALHFDNTLVLVQVEPQLEKETFEMMKESIVYALDGYSPQVTIKRFGKPAPPKPEKVPTPLEKDNSLREHINSILLMISAVLLGLALVFSAYFVRKGVFAVAEGIRSLGKSTAKDSDEEDPARTEGKLTIGGDDSPFPIKLPPDLTGSYDRNMVALRWTLEVTPETIAQELQAAPEDAEGLRWLLPALEPGQQDVLKIALGPPKTKQLLAMASSAPGQQNAEFLEARYHWLQRFVERLALRRLRGLSPVDAALGPELIQQLSAIKVTEIEQWVLTQEDPAAWRVASEFVPPERLSRLLEKIEMEKWPIVAQAAGANSVQLHTAGKSLVESRTEKDPVAAARGEVRKDFFQRVLAQPITQALKQFSLEDQEWMLESLELENPDLIQFLGERFWSLRHLRRINDEVLASAFRHMGTEQKVLLVAALPEEEARRFRKWVPEGNIRIILNDRVDTIWRRKDKEEMAMARDFAQRFLEGLRQQNLSGKFDLEVIEEAVDSGSDREAA